MSAGWVEPVALDSRAHLDGVAGWDRRVRSERRKSLRLPWVAFGLAAVAAGAIAFSPVMQRRAEAPVSKAPTPVAEFQTRTDLPPLFYVKSLDGGQASAIYESETRGADGARRDTLTLGDPSSEKPFLRASARLGAAERPPLFFVELARQAAMIGQAVAHASSPESGSAGARWLSSEVTLEAGGRQRTCVGFRFAGVGATDLSGIVCGGAGQKVERAALQCLISRLEPTAAGAAAGLDKVLRNAAAEGGSC